MSGFCGTQVMVGMYSGEASPYKQCPNCGRRKTAAHLMLCPDNDRTRLLIENVDELSKWLDTDSRTDPELAYWIPKINPDVRRQTFLDNGIHVPKAKSPCRVPGLYRLEEFHQRAHLYTILRDTNFPSCDFKQLPQWVRLDQAVKHKDPTNYAFTLDIPKHFAPWQTSGIPPQ